MTDWVWESEISALSSGNSGWLLLLTFYAFISVSVPIVLIVVYYINELLVIWDEGTIQHTVPGIVAESVLFFNILVASIVLYAHSRQTLGRPSLYLTLL